MKKRLLIVATLLASLSLGSRSSHAAVSIPVSIDLSQITFNGGGGGVFNIGGSQLPPQVFMYKPIVFWPLRISRADRGRVNTNNLRAEIVYQVFNDQGNAITIPTPLPITFVRDANPNNLIGTGFVPIDVIRLFQVGYKFTYYMQVVQNGQTSYWGNPNAPFSTSIIDTMSVPVAQNDVSFSVPDSNQTSKPTQGILPRGVLPNQSGTLLVHQESPQTALPYNGLAPVIQFSMRYESSGNNAPPTGAPFIFSNLPLSGPFHFTISYAANPDGSVFMLSGAPSVRATDLAPYCMYDGAWRLVDRPNINTTQHTVSFTTQKLSSCALFATGPVGAADVRPMQRILTPNGDGVNDSVTFLGVTSNDQVKIFDVRGRRIREMSGPNPTWDGREDNGSIVESGVYIYQYTSQGERVSGVIVIAK